MRLVLFVATLFVASCVAQAPPLPFSAFHLEFRRSMSDSDGTKTLEGYGAVDDALETECIWSERWLPLANSTESFDVTANYTRGTMQRRILHNDGLATNCSTLPLPKNWTKGGNFFFPSEAERAALKFAEYRQINHRKMAVYTGVRNKSGLKSLVNWTIFDDTKVPYSYLVTDLIPSANTTVSFLLEFTFVKRGELPGRCRSPLSCGTKMCVAKPQATAAALQGALAWTCGVVDCAPIQQGGAFFYPDTVEAHTTWAFSEYYETHKSINGDQACDFSGLGELTVCQVNTTCIARSNATTKALEDAIKWICSPAGLQDCSPILPGGLYFFPNTTVNHANWAFNAYYQPYKCVPGWNACDFNGAAEIVADFN